MSVLQAIGISKTWQDNTLILDSVDLNVESGETIAIVGKSGSGKSTFLQICGLLDGPSSGKIIIDGQDCSNMSDVTQTMIRRYKIGFVYQFHHLLSEFTVIENLVIPQLICQVDEKLAEKKAMSYLDRFNLIDRKDFPVQKLSGGEKQRIAIIRSIVNNPKLIIADEPTGNLDNYNAINAFNLLQEIVSQSGAAMVIATHSLELANLCSRVISLENGKFKCN